MKYAVENGIIDLSYVQEKIEMNKREELLKKHTYRIWQGTNGYWYTKFPDDNGKYSQLKKRKDKWTLEDDIVKFWRTREENPTVYEVFTDWVEGKFLREEIEPATRDRYKRQFDQCFSAIRNRHIKDISEYDLEEFVLNSIHDNELTQKGFSNMRTLIFGIFKMAKKNKLIKYSVTEVVNDMDISRKNFRSITKENADEVFTEEELPIILEYLEENIDFLNLGILLLFKTGLRIGELVALKKEDVLSYNKIHVNRTEIIYKDNSGKMQYEVRNSPKTEESIRTVLIPDKYCWILKRIQMMSSFGEYLFEWNNERIRSYVFRNRLYTICRKCGIKRKSPHKVRKTYSTILIDSGAEESLVLSQMGHREISTTRKYYYKDMKSQGTKMNRINSMVGL